MPKYIVCFLCDGEGYTSRLGAFTIDDMDSWFGGDYEERDEFVSEYTKRGGAYDEACELCKGQRVITPEQEKAYEAEAEMRAEMLAEQRAGC